MSLDGTGAVSRWALMDDGLTFERREVGGKLYYFEKKSRNVNFDFVSGPLLPWPEPRPLCRLRPGPHRHRHKLQRREHGDFAKNIKKKLSHFSLYIIICIGRLRAGGRRALPV